MTTYGMPYSALPSGGFLLQAPFTAMVTRRLEVQVDFRAPENPWAMAFAMGGVALGVPLAEGVAMTRDEARSAGWDLHTTDDSAPTALHLRLEP
jgi:hypothetical protein